MGTAAGFLAEARRSLGTRGRPNHITQDYARRHGNVFLREPWCDMSITYWARASGNTASVLPGGDRAYTVWHAQDFEKAGRWHSGTTANVNDAKPGDIVFFDWGATNQVGAIDHVGVVEKALGGGRVQTIEGNTGDACLRKVRSSDVIAGYGRPAYDNHQEDELPSVKEVWTTDGIIESPPDKQREGNKFWTPGSYLVWGYRQGAATQQKVATLEKKVDALGAQLTEIKALLTAKES